MTGFGARSTAVVTPTHGPRSPRPGLSPAPRGWGNETGARMRTRTATINAKKVRRGVAGEWRDGGVEGAGRIMSPDVASAEGGVDGFVPPDLAIEGEITPDHFDARRCQPPLTDRLDRNVRPVPVGLEQLGELLR